jgi:tetratricopeptide (TPR) repeat protein
VGSKIILEICESIDNTSPYNEKIKIEERIKFYKNAIDTLKIYQDATPLWQKCYAECMTAMGQLYLKKHDFAAAKNYLTSAMELKAGVYGYESNEYAWACDNLANWSRDNRRYYEYLELYLKANKIWEKVLGECHLTTIGS